jgi:carbon storage regulator CsrA
MLILSRKKQESIIIETPEGDVITIKIVSLRSRFDKEAVQIGIEAPKDFPIRREP